MASQPLFPQPAQGPLHRVRAFLGIGTADENPKAQPVPEAQAKEAAPESEKAPVPQGQVSRSPSGFSIDPRWLSELALNDDKILTHEGAHNLELFEALLDDDIAASAFQQRRMAVVSRPWEVEAGDESPQAKAAADHLRDQLKRLSWDHICDKMLFGIWFGWGVGEAMFEIGPDGKIWIDKIIVPDRKWFGFTNAGELRLKTADNPSGEVLPENKFWAYRAGASHDFKPYGVGLAHWCYWPVWFKKNVIKFWSVYLEKFGMPTALGKFPQGSTADDQASILTAAAAVGRDAAVAIPDNMALELLASGRPGDGSYLEFVGEMNDSLLRIILSQTGTSKAEAQGLGGSQSEVHKDVRDEVVRADSDLLHESFNGTIARWVTAWNFGPNVAPPRLYRNLEDQEDLTAIVERDEALKRLGYERTEESAREVYGEAYEKMEAPEPQLPAPGFQRGQLADQRDSGGNIVDLQEERKRRAAEFSAMDPAPLYVSRKLRPSSAKALLAWAAKEGIPNLEPASELHVTVLYSKAPVDWFEMAGEGWDWERVSVPKGGPRKVLKLGDKGAIVLRFASAAIEYRHKSMLERGASHDFDSYEPHITIAYAPDFDPESIEEAFQGELLFAEERFEPINDDWTARIANRNFSAAEMDDIERLAADLAREADPMIAEFAASLRGKTRGIKDVDSLRIALLEALERFPAERMGELAALPFASVRAAAQAGLDA